MPRRELHCTLRAINRQPQNLAGRKLLDRRLGRRVNRDEGQPPKQCNSRSAAPGSPASSSEESPQILPGLSATSSRQFTHLEATLGSRPHPWQPFEIVSAPLRQSSQRSDNRQISAIFCPRRRQSQQISKPPRLRTSAANFHTSSARQ